MSSRQGMIPGTKPYSSVQMASEYCREIDNEKSWKLICIYISQTEFDMHQMGSGV